MKIYLASPWFKNNERVMYRSILDKLRADGYEVYAPVEHQVPDAWELSNTKWGKEVFNADVQAIKECDAVWILNFGMYSDSGTAWECGFAYGIGKPIHQLLYNFTEDKTFSLMMVNGCDNYETMLNYLTDTHDFPIKIEQK